MRSIILFTVLVLIVKSSFAQFSQRTLETDSSYVDIVINGKLKFWEETYKERDSIRYKVYYFPDTMKLKLEGWRNDAGERLGEWSEYNKNGAKLYTLDYEKHTCKYNEPLYPFLLIKDKMIKKADTLIMKKFGKSFFRKNVIFDFNGYTYVWKLENYPTGRFYTREKLGDWVTPIYKKPEGFMLRYTIELSPNERYRDILHIELDSLGRAITDTVDDAINFKDLSLAIRNPMTIERQRAISICKRYPLQQSDYDYQTELKYGFAKDGLHPGEFYYEVAQLYDQKKEVNDRNSAMVKYYNVWRLNPYTSELYYKKQQKIITKSGSGYGVTGKFLELDE